MKRNNPFIRSEAKGRTSGSLALESSSSFEEGDFVNYDDFISSSKDTTATKTTEFFFQQHSIVKHTTDDYQQKQFGGNVLFHKTTHIQIDEPEKELPRDPSVLVTGFGMRNVKSFQKLMDMSKEERKKWELRKLWRDEMGQKARELLFEKQEEKISAGHITSDVSTASGPGSIKSSVDFLSQTESVKSDVDHKKTLDYLLGLETEAEEEPKPFSKVKPFEEEEDTFKYSSSKSVREAQSYLRSHRIFECFQFIIAHLLSANPENPIEFILNLINRCLLYRSGLGEPPLLYNRKHITQLFNIMDRLQSGFIDKDQYVSGMKTIGVCSYNENPETNDDGEILLDTFVEEAYEAEVAIFDDMIKRRPGKAKKGARKLPQETFDTVSIPSAKTPYFVPSDLFKSSKTDFVDQLNDEQ
ncbi:unnamed protein product [Ceutorhynchus assimilis]|uniref:EF-hand domain-containing protein n=1 Tax=Ceutorhynchus assimilis TaxID=467358 RepID=A0A9N9N259_9CUCU|nr:unnamed protein product [Ceutorhynchus assimilis]